MFHSDSSYWLPVTRINTKRWMTNTVSNTAFRGFGGPQGMLMAERMIDEIAWALGSDRSTCATPISTGRGGT